tara:strand:+ start:334 stop:507 length:174 start_codon:yes stop_codon:yes gene_type:complete
MKTIKNTFNSITEDFNPAQKIVVASLATFTALCLVSILYKVLANFSDVQNASFGLIG